MYKIVLLRFVIVSCFVFFASGQGDVDSTQPSAIQTECAKFQNCTECLDDSTLNCTFCSFPTTNNGTCIANSTSCHEQGGIPVHSKAQCSPISPEPSANSTTVMTTKTELPTTEASSSGASESTTVPSKPSPVPSGRHFDPPSFIGGTVLSLGLLAIVYVGFKFYKARTERNYHTL